MNVDIETALMQYARVTGCAEGNLDVILRTARGDFDLEPARALKLIEELAEGALELMKEIQVGQR